MIDGTGKPTLKDSTIIIDGNRIKEVGSRIKIEIPEEATNIELTGITITPGFIDSPLHYFIFSISPKFINLSDTKSLQEAVWVLIFYPLIGPRDDLDAGFHWESLLTADEFPTVCLRA